MTVFLTPAQEPFFCGTYFPPEGAGGRPGFRQVVLEVAKAYRERRKDVALNGETIRRELGKLNRMPESGDGIISHPPWP